MCVHMYKSHTIGSLSFVACVVDYISIAYPCIVLFSGTLVIQHNIRSYVACIQKCSLCQMINESHMSQSLPRANTCSYTNTFYFDNGVMV